MVSISNGLPHPGNAFFLIELILASLAGITALLAFILIRRVTRSVHFRRHDALAFAIRKQWSEILNGVVPAESWRQDPMRREIVQTNVLQELEDACPKDRPQFQEFMRTMIGIWKHVSPPFAVWHAWGFLRQPSRSWNAS
jgi:hypothetical protein